MTEQRRQMMTSGQAPGAAKEETIFQSGQRDVVISLVVEDLSALGAGYLTSLIGEAASRVGVVKVLQVRTARCEPEGPPASAPARRPSRTPQGGRKAR